MRLLLMAIGIGCLSGCAGISRQACVDTDWHAAGVSDGTIGRPAETHAAYREACGRMLGEPYDRVAYDLGRAKGLETFCKPERGFSIGADGRAYNGICAGVNESRFVAAYSAGRALYVLERAVAHHESKIRQAHYELRQIEHDIAQNEAALIAPDTNQVDRKRLRADLAALEENVHAIKSSMSIIRDNEDRDREKLEGYRTLITQRAPAAHTVIQATSINY